MMQNDENIVRGKGRAAPSGKERFTSRRIVITTWLVADEPSG